MHAFTRAFATLFVGLFVLFPAHARFLSADPVPPDANAGANFNRYAYANNNPYAFKDPDGRLPILVPIIAGVSLYFASGNAEAPSPGQRTSAMSAGEAALHFVDAFPFGRATLPARVAVDVVRRPDAQTGSYTNTHSSGKTYDGKGSRERSQQSAQRVEQATGDTHTATDWTAATTSREAFKQESQRLDSHGGPKSDTNYNQIDSPGKKYRQEDAGP